MWEISRNLELKTGNPGPTFTVQYIAVYMHIAYTCTYSCREGGSVEPERRGEGQQGRVQSTELGRKYQHDLKVHKNEDFFGFDFEFCTISLLVMHK